ncbi:hypothetical protein OHS33_38765 (plasmid) [Streptomyces sp. NBC_00536]|uniref:hypothetical protein n=1 Tax=Streptomyces sp. NBC_00536 TaxID=2975769 RepID=UPI002E81D998|nr:hypothetical protein [Streptomyces sp. NBC_00536]WUC84446.1 hypothetical protein OHS33_38765 [Streptomyces sp. NBC_00536]
MTTLTLSMDDALAAEVEAEADRCGLPVDEYVAAVLRAAQTPGGGGREARAQELARGAFAHWNAAGRTEDGAMSMAEVFGR